MPKPRYNARLSEVVDGDTFKFDLFVEVLDYDLIIKDVDVRLLGVDTHETYGTDEDSKEHKLGESETAYVKRWFAKGEQAYDGKFPFTVVVREQEVEGKYGRILGSVIRQCDGKSLEKALESNFEGVDTE